MLFIKFNKIVQFDIAICAFLRSRINNMLIYGIGFQRSGHIRDEFLAEYLKYENEVLSGTVVDEHILMRIKVLQNKGLLQKITISYFSEQEKQYFKMLLYYYGINNIEFINVRELRFII